VEAAAGSLPHSTLSSDLPDDLFALYEAALACSAAERDRFLASVRVERPGLFDDLDAMLGADDVPGFLEPPEELESGPSPAARVGERLGPYELIEPLGTGGTSAVFRAHQARPIERDVALKVLRAPRIDQRARERFADEGAMLGGLVHAGIAQVHDAGEDEGGRLYLAMELVDGAPITRWCDQARLGLDARLALFRDVVDAVQYAHQRGVIHRDVKASNVLVKIESGVPRPKLIDFGIATLRGADGQLRAGTPGAMSPEQAAGLPTDTRTDVFGLGVLLYELCAGARPFAGDTSFHLRPEVPPAPPRSLLRAAHAAQGGLRGVAAHRDITPAALERRLAGDLDAVARRAVSVSPADRYPTAAALGDDVLRVLRHEPVAARKATLAHAAQLFARRHRVAVGLVLLLVLAVTSAILALSWALRQVDSARERAVEQSVELDELARARLFREYTAQLAAASAAFEAGDAARAAEHLRAAPVEHRGWEWRHLASRCDGSVWRVDTWPTIHGMVWLDDTRLMTLHQGHLEVRDVAEGRLLVAIGGPRSEFDDVLVDRDRGVVVLDRRDRLELVSADDISPVERLVDLTSDVRGMALDPTARWIATSDNLGDVRMIRIADGLSRVVADLGAYARHLAFLADGAVLLVADAHGRLHGIDASPPEGDGDRPRSPLWTIELGTEAIKGLALGPDRATAYAGLGSEVVRVDLASRRTTGRRSVGAEVHDVELSADGDTLYVGGGWMRSELVAFDPSTLQVRRRFFGHARGVGAIAPSPDGRLVVSGDAEGALLAWDPSLSGGAAEVRAAGYDARTISVSPDGRAIATASRDGDAIVWDTETMEAVLEVATDLPLRACALGDGTLYLAGDQLTVRDPGPRQELIAVDRATGEETRRVPLTTPLSRLALSRDGSVLAGTSARLDRVQTFRTRDLSLLDDLVVGGAVDVRPAAGGDAFLILTTGPSGPLLLTPGTGTLAREETLPADTIRVSEDRRAVIRQPARLAVGESGAWIRDGMTSVASDERLCDRVFSGGQDDHVRVLTGDGEELLVLRDAPKPVEALILGVRGRHLFGLSRFPGSPSYLLRWSAPSEVELR